MFDFGFLRVDPKSHNKNHILFLGNFYDVLGLLAFI
jgi:hypothetical protein